MWAEIFQPAFHAADPGRAFFFPPVFSREFRRSSRRRRPMGGPASEKRGRKGGERKKEEEKRVAGSEFRRRTKAEGNSCSVTAGRRRKLGFLGIFLPFLTLGAWRLFGRFFRPSSSETEPEFFTCAPVVSVNLPLKVASCFFPALKIRERKRRSKEREKKRGGEQSATSSRSVSSGFLIVSYFCNFSNYRARASEEEAKIASALFCIYLPQSDVTASDCSVRGQKKLWRMPLKGKAKN